ncbi:hypothetical protein RQP46_005053 [Phenoliferia psychrophenolica]
MPKATVSRSTFNSRVTLYEPPTAAASGSGSTSSSTRPSTRRSPRPPAASTSALATAPEDVKPSTKVKSSPAKSPRKPTPFKLALEKPHPAPKRWQEAYEVIRKQREGIVAPVDTMGCEQGGHDRTSAPPPPTSTADHNLSILISLMLSSQTKDPVTHAAVQALRASLPGGVLSLATLKTATADEIDAAICKVGFHTTKAKNLVKLAVRLEESHGGLVPEDLPSLLAIDGVGPKMSILFLQAIGINAGIGVDVHVHRISNRLGWHKPATTTPEGTRLNLESWLPKELHPKINLMLVGFGQMICKPVGPRCDLCDVAKVPRLCPSKKAVSPAKKRGGGVKKEEGALAPGCTTLYALVCVGAWPISPRY